MFWNRRYAGDDDDSLPGSSISTKATQPDDSGSLMLQNSGRIVEMQSNPHTVRAHGGLIRKLENYSMRGRHWPYTSSCVDAHAGNFAVSDDRGQVYALNVHDNNYKLVRSASSAVCAMCFIPCRSNQLIVSYESGQVLLVDKDSKEIIGNIQSETSGFAPVRLIRSHPTKAMAILASEDGVVALWDLRKMACKLSLECDEPILDVRFELNGSLVMLALQESGIFVYRSNDLQLLRSCPLPHTERQPKWLSFQSHVLMPMKDTVIDKNTGQKRSVLAGDPHFRPFLAADNGCLYVWDVDIPNEVAHFTEAYDVDEDTEIQECSLLGVVELPATCDDVIEVTSLTSGKQLGTRVDRYFMLTRDGGGLLIDVVDASFATLGTWGLIANYSPSHIMGAPPASHIPFYEARGDLYDDDKQALGESKGAEQSERFIFYPHVIASSIHDVDGDLAKEARRLKEYIQSNSNTMDMSFDSNAGAMFYRREYNSNTKTGRVSGNEDHMVTVGGDGCARIFDIDATLGMGEMAGTGLRTRGPHQYTRRHELKRLKHTSIGHHKYTASSGSSGGGSGVGGGKTTDAMARLKNLYSARAASNTTTNVLSAYEAEAMASDGPMEVNASKGAYRGQKLQNQPSGGSDSTSTSTPSAGAHPAQSSLQGLESDGSGKVFSQQQSAAREQRHVRMADTQARLRGLLGAADSPGGGSGGTRGGAADPGSATDGVGQVTGEEPPSVASGSSYTSTGASSSSGSNTNTASNTKSNSGSSSSSSSSGTAGPFSISVSSSGASGASGATPTPEQQSLEEHRQAKLRKASEVALLKRTKREEKEKKREEAAAASEKRRQARRERRAQAEQNGITARALTMFELTALSSDEVLANRTKLSAFLDHHSEYPGRYRPLIWRFLLQLPENIDAYEGLSSQGIHKEHADLSVTYPIEDTTTLDRLTRVCSALTHWSPVFLEFSNLPQMVFPFVIIYGSDELSAVESIISVFMYWGYSFFVSYPAEPKHIYDTLDKLLEIHDKRLKYHLDSVLSEQPGKLGFSLMSSLYTTILSAPDWLKLMDFLILHFESSTYMLLAPIALLKMLKVSLLAIDTEKNLLEVVKQQHYFDMSELTEMIIDMSHHTPGELKHVLIDTLVDEEGANAKKANKKAWQAGDGEDSSNDEAEKKRWNAIAHSNDDVSPDYEKTLCAYEAVFPLPRKGNHYPSYNNYARELLEMNVRTRSRGETIVKQIYAKKATLANLKKQSQDLTNDHAQWLMRQQTKRDSERTNQLEIMNKEKRHMREVLRLEEEISRQRVDTLSKVESIAREELEVMNTQAANTSEFITTTQNHMDDKMSMTINVQKHRELAENTQLAMDERLRKMHLRRTREEFTKGVTTTLQGKERELEAQNVQLAEEWRRQDEEMAIRRNERIARAKEMAEHENMSRLQDEMTHRVQRLLLERETKVMEIERARQIRAAKNESDAAAESAERSALALQKYELNAALEKAAELATLGHDAISQRMGETIDQIRNDSAALLETEQVHMAQARESRHSLQDTLLKQQWAENQSKILKDMVAQEQELQTQVGVLQRKQVELEMESQAVKQTQNTRAAPGSAGERSSDSSSSGSGVQSQYSSSSSSSYVTGSGTESSDTASLPIRGGRGNVSIRSEDLQAEYAKVEQMGDDILSSQRERYQEMMKKQLSTSTRTSMPTGTSNTSMSNSSNAYSSSSSSYTSSGVGGKKNSQSSTQAYEEAQTRAKQLSDRVRALDAVDRTNMSTYSQQVHDTALQAQQLAEESARYGAIDVETVREPRVSVKRSVGVSMDTAVKQSTMKPAARSAKESSSSSSSSSSYSSNTGSKSTK